MEIYYYQVVPDNLCRNKNQSFLKGTRKLFLYDLIKKD